MPKVVLGAGLARWLQNAGTAPTGEIALDVNGSTVGDALECAFAAHPTLRSYVVDDQGIVRHHVVIFIDGLAVRDKALLQMPIVENAELYIMQALSGG